MTQTVGRPKFQPTEELRTEVEQMVGFRFPQAAIARALNISVPTLCKHFRNELDCGRKKADFAVAGAIWAKAVSGHMPAAMFWARVHMGWQEQKPKTQPVGKKEKADIDAKVAHKGTTWEALLPDVRTVASQ